MTRDEVHAVIEDLVKKYEGHFDPPVEREEEAYDAPTEADWEYLREKLDCTFSPEFLAFMELITAYNRPGVLDVTREGRTNGDPTVDWTYDHEMSFGRWDPDLVPLLDIGDGSFYCLRRSAGESSPVYYAFHVGDPDEVAPSFEAGSDVSSTTSTARRPDPGSGWLNGRMATVEDLGENRVRLTVEVPPEQVKHAVEHALSDLSESAKIPGFRKGKVPEPILVSRLGKDRIYREAVDSHIGGWFWSAASRNRLRPVAEPQFAYELPSTADVGWSFVATVDVQPLPDISDWTQLEVARAEIEVPEESVDAEIEALRESVAELAPANGRPAQEGDTLVVDLVDPSGEAQRDTVVELGSGRMTPELEAALVGAKAGETKSVSFPRGDGSTGSVEVTVKEVQEKILPPLDDELARAASEFDTLGELRESITATLREQLDAEIDAAYRMAAVDELVRDSNVQPAASLVQSRAADLLTGFVRSLERRGVSVETYLAASGTSAEDLQRNFILEAAVSIARELALEALAEKAGIEVTDDEVKAYLREEAEAAGEGDDAEQLIEDVWAHGQQESIREDLRLRAALDRLVADVKPIAPDLAAAREKLWTPDKEKPEGETKLWTPGDKEPA